MLTLQKPLPGINTPLVEMFKSLQTQTTLSLEEFQATCERGRAMRKRLERGAFTKARTATTPQNFRMVPLKLGRSHADIADNKTSKMKRTKKQSMFRRCKMTVKKKRKKSNNQNSLK